MTEENQWPVINDADRYVSALQHAMALEMDGDFLRTCGTDMVAYSIKCRELLRELYGIVPYPFDRDYHWGS